MYDEKEIKLSYHDPLFQCYGGVGIYNGRVQDEMGVPRMSSVCFKGGTRLLAEAMALTPPAVF